MAVSVAIVTPRRVLTVVLNHFKTLAVHSVASIWESRAVFQAQVVTRYDNTANPALPVWAPLHHFWAAFLDTRRRSRSQALGFIGTRSLMLYSRADPCL